MYLREGESQGSWFMKGLDQKDPELTKSGIQNLPEVPETFDRFRVSVTKSKNSSMVVTPLIALASFTDICEKKSLELERDLEFQIIVTYYRSSQLKFFRYHNLIGNNKSGSSQPHLDLRHAGNTNT